MSLQSPAKTIAHARAGGERRWLPIGAARTAIIAVKTFEELKLRNDIMFITVPQHRRLACSKCGCRNVKVTPILPAGRARPRLSGVSYQNHNDYWQRYSAITDESVPKIEQDKSILIFADGTGNEGGLLPDESRTNVYKLYRATRVDPESKIDPEKQIAFYIRGIGTIIPGKSSIIRQLNDNLAQMFGNGFEDRLIQCFTAVISVWKPGDRIYLFEFSRGAYIVRCLAHLLERLGIPTQESSRRQLSLDPRKLRPIAKSGVRIYYRFGLTTKDDEAKDKRAREWCKVHNSQMDAVPYFVGVWDTVAAMGWERLFPSRYEKHLPPVMFVRHAMAIDEYRKDFARAAWGSTHTMRPPVQGEPLPFKQVWFAGNHADIGGSYPENESRLSDITLDWIAGFVSKDLPEPCRVCVSKRFLNLHPSCRGMMHDECMAGKIHWSKKVRAVDQHGELHQLRQISSSSSAQF